MRGVGDGSIEGEASDDLAELVSRAKEGYRDAFDQLLQRFEARALSIPRQMGLSPEDAQDVAQEAFLKLFRYISKFRSGESFTNWFYRIVVHATYDHLRNRQRGGLSLEDESISGASEMADDAPLAPEQLERSQMRERLLRCMGGLAKKERAAFVLRDLQGLDTKTVARALRVSQVTVRRHASNARRKIRERLERQYPEILDEHR